MCAGPFIRVNLKDSLKILSLTFDIRTIPFSTLLSIVIVLSSSDGLVDRLSIAWNLSYGCSYLLCPRSLWIRAPPYKAFLLININTNILITEAWTIPFGSLVPSKGEAPYVGGNNILPPTSGASAFLPIPLHYAHPPQYQSSSLKFDCLQLDAHEGLVCAVARD